MATSDRRTSPLTTALAALVLGGALYVGSVPLRGAPPLGRFLDPVHGVWAVATRANLPSRESHMVRGLGTTVDVRFDDRGVPHIFAATLDDAYRALGWVHARDRLFQLEIQTRAVAGTLTELLGPRALPLDREARAMGLAWGAERSFAAMPLTAASTRAIRAYADGINAYIGSMSAADLPLEYHLLSATPMRWEPVYTAYLLSRMGLTLAFSDGELRRADIEALVGKPAAEAVFPENAPIQEPIQPNGRHAPRFDFAKIPAPHVDIAAFTPRFDFSRLTTPRDADGEISVGSNNWAVAPRRTAAGYALLAGDPHLSLSLPSVWYEAHLVVPDSIDTYGVTLPGSPVVPIGFNRDVAWTATNTGADVTDYYVETVDDDAHPTRYRLDGAWKPLRVRVETMRGRDGRPLVTDTIYQTHRGPMLRTGNRWVSRRWTVLEPSDVVDAFQRVNRAKSTAEVMAGLAGYEVPAQNFLAADRGGHIAIRTTAHFPVRPRGAPRGDVLVDGSTSANDWQGWLPVVDYPQALDPAQGYLTSNNQQPKDPAVDPRYSGWDWPAPWRAMRINSLLRGDPAVTPDAMRRFQTDPVSEQTQLFLRAFAHAAAAAPAPVDSAVARGARILNGWDGAFTLENERAFLYSLALDELNRLTWDELTMPGAKPGDRPVRLETPNSMILAELLEDPKNAWWDIRSTPVVEDRDMILRAALGAAYTRATKQAGPFGPAWRWRDHRQANINHLLRIPALSRLGIPMQAGPGTLSPSGGDGTHGASWRMVVELAPDVRAWGTYPGGQSGNPASPRYDDRLAAWTAGTLDTLRFPRRATELTGGRLTSTLTLTPARAP